MKRPNEFLGVADVSGVPSILCSRSRTFVRSTFADQAVRIRNQHVRSASYSENAMPS